MKQLYLPKIIISFCILIIALLESQGALAMPPDTLDFGFAKYVKAKESLYREPVRHISVKDDGAESYPSSILFDFKIIFLDKTGNEIGRDSLPDTSGVKVTESAQGNYIYVFGAKENKPGGFHSLYTVDGKNIFKRVDTGVIGTRGLGTPLEELKAFLLGGFGKVSLTGFDGKLIAEKQLLNKALLEDGDIFAVSVSGDRQFFVAANKFKLPIGQATFNLPILYAFDSKLNETIRDTLNSYLVIGLEAVPNNQYLLLREESDTASLLWVLDYKGNRLASFDNPKSIVFSSNNKILIVLPRSGPIAVASSTDWKTIYSPRVSSLYFWGDASISDDGSLGTLFNGSEITLLDINNKNVSKIDFPFAFSICHLYDNGRRLILTGEFGYEIYQRAK